MELQSVPSWSDFCRAHGGMLQMEFISSPLFLFTLRKTLLWIAHCVDTGTADLEPETGAVRMGDDVLETYVRDLVYGMLEHAALNTDTVETAVASAMVLEAARMALRWDDVTPEERAFVFGGLTPDERTRIPSDYISFAAKFIESLPEESEEDLKGDKPVDLATRLMVFWRRNSEQPPAWYTRAWTAAVSA